MDHDHGSHSCSEHLATPSVHQTLEELDFNRGIWQAAVDGDSKEVERCLNSGKNSTDQTDSSGYTALHYASRNGHADVCRILLQHGTGVNVQTRSGRATALHRAAYCGHTEVINLLLKNGAYPTIEDSDGMVPLHKAAERGHQSVAEVLLAASQDTKNHRDNRGRLPVDCVPRSSSKLTEILKTEMQSSGNCS